MRSSAPLSSGSTTTATPTSSPPPLQPPTAPTRHAQNVLPSSSSLGSPYVDCQSAGSTPTYNISVVPSVITLDLGGLAYTLWSPNPSVREGDMKLILTPSADALWSLAGLPPDTPTPCVSNATAFQVLPPCNSGVNVTVGVPSASATPSRTATASHSRAAGA